MAFVETLIFLLPASRAKNWILRRLGHLISPDARISPILALGVSHFEVGPQSSIGPFNVFRDMSLVEIGKCAIIGQWNWISAARPLVELGAPGEIHIADHAAITSRNRGFVTGSPNQGAFPQLVSTIGISKVVDGLLQHILKE